MMKLIKKHAGGGWLKDKAGKDRIGYWDYSDSNDPDMQKKIARYYTLSDTQKEDEVSTVKSYLNAHSNLASYLDSVYKQGIDWEGQAALGNKDRNHHQYYRDSNDSGDTTDKAISYIKSLGYKNYEEFKKALSAAGYIEYTKGTFIKKDNNNNPQYYWIRETPTGLAFLNKNNKSAIVDKDTLNKQAQVHASRSKAYHAWDNIAKLYRSGHSGGWFSSAMQKKKFNYDPRTGQYLRPGLMAMVRNNKIAVSSRPGQYTYLSPEEFIEKYLE